MDSKSIFKKLTKTGKEILNRTPIAIPLGFSRPKSITEQIAEFVTNQKTQEQLDAAGFETFEDAEDFEIGDDYESLPESKYEADFDNIKSGLALEREKARKSAQQNSSKPAAGEAPQKQKKTVDKISKVTDRGLEARDHGSSEGQEDPSHDE